MDDIVLFGGSGNLGRNILDNLNCIAPTHKEIDLTNYSELESSSLLNNIKVIIHSAGYVDTNGCENNPQKCLDINVMSTYNLVKLCRLRNIKLIYISSEYVFSGSENEYYTYTPTDPKNNYGLSKAASELIVKTLDNYLIIRAPFIRTKKFIYPNAFEDQFLVRQYIDKAAIDIVDCILNNKSGIQHIIGTYQSVYDLAKKTNKNIHKIPVPLELKNILPLTLNLKE